MTPILLAAAGAWLALLALAFGVLHRRALGRLWREPLLRHPVLIIESDDWGPGPASDAQVLGRLAEILARRRDRLGHTAVMTLGIILAVADTERIRASGGREYFARPLSDEEFVPIVQAIRQGMEAGVFSPQLHGMEHYWPAAVMKAAARDEQVHAWLVQDGVPRHEDLPAELQSRWIDGSELPSRPLPSRDVAESAEHETHVFKELFGISEPVVVPPTFLWTEATEAAWAAAGTRVVVTPGVRFSARDGRGNLLADGARHYNGEHGVGHIRYLVRDDYFEPARGHRAERALAALKAKTALGRPTLLETHRSNFTGSAAQRDDALREIERFLTAALEALPHVRLMSTRHLAVAMGRGDPNLVENRLVPRIRGWLARAALVPELRRLAWISGAILPAWALYRAVGFLSRPALRTA